jgi:hypothetical protein
VCCYIIIVDIGNYENSPQLIPFLLLGLTTKSSVNVTPQAEFSILLSGDKVLLNTVP